MIPYGKHSICEDDIQAVVDVLSTSLLTQGSMVPNFEQKLSEKFSSQYCVAMNSATSALHAAYLALGVTNGDTVWTVPNTFVASSNAAIAAGAKIDFVDIEADSFNLDAIKLEQKLKIAESLGSLPKVVTPVHFAGRPCDMEQIRKLSLRYGFKVLEDASHAVGAKIGSTYIGACKYSDITVFSFHPVKIITTAEGGAALTNCAKLEERLRLYCGHGIVKEPSKFSEPNFGPWYYEQVELGFNFRMSDIHAALGISQLSKLDHFLDKRNKLANRYDSIIKHPSIKKPIISSHFISTWHLYVISLQSRCSKQHKKLFEILRQEGIGVQLHYMPVHLQPYYRRLGFGEGYCPVSEQHGQSAISLPLYPDLTDNEQDEVIAKLELSMGSL